MPLAAGLSPRRFEFVPRAQNVGFMVAKVALVQTEVPGEKRVTESPCPPEIPYWLAWKINWATVTRDQRLPPWAMVGPNTYCEIIALLLSIWLHGRVRVEKRTVSHLVAKFPSICVSRMFNWIVHKSPLLMLSPGFIPPCIICLLFNSVALRFHGYWLCMVKIRWSNLIIIIIIINS
jgi:hypothetical protein